MRKLKKPIKPLNFTDRKELGLLYGYESGYGGPAQGGVGGGCFTCSTWNDSITPGAGIRWGNFGRCDWAGTSPGSCGTPTANSQTPSCYGNGPTAGNFNPPPSSCDGKFTSTIPAFCDGNLIYPPASPRDPHIEPEPVVVLPPIAPATP